MGPLLFLIRSQTHNSGTDIIGWPGRPVVCVCVCVCISLGLSVRVTPQVPPTAHTRRTWRVHKRELVGSSARQHTRPAFFLSCLLFLFLSNGHDFLPVFHQNFGAPNFIDAQEKYGHFFFFGGREHFLRIRREIQTGHRAA